MPTIHLTQFNDNFTLSELSGTWIVFGDNGEDVIQTGATGSTATFQVDGGNGKDTLIGIGGTQNLSGGNGADTITGGVGSDVLKGDNGPDVLRGNGGNDTLIGGNGPDTAVFAGARADYTVTRDANSWTVTDRVAGRDGTDNLVEVERLRFSDVAVAFDVNGDAGVVARLIGAVFGRQHVQNREFVGTGLNLLDAELTSEQLAHAAVNSQFFASLAGSRSNRDFVNLVYTNVVGSAPSASELESYTRLLDNGTYTQASLALAAAESGLNQQNINLVGLQQTGLEYI